MTLNPNTCAQFGTLLLIRKFGWFANVGLGPSLQNVTKSAFHLLPVHLDDFELLGVAFEGHYYMDRALPMACCIPCSTFDHLSSYLEWATKRKSWSKMVLHYLNVFLFAGWLGSTGYGYLLLFFMDSVRELSVPLAHEKMEAPVQKTWFPWHGYLLIRWNIYGILSLPLSRRKKSTLLELLQFMGHLNFACKTVAASSAFLHRLFSPMAGLWPLHHRVYILAVLIIWLRFFQGFNRVSFWREDLRLEAKLQVFYDAISFLVFTSKDICVLRVGQSSGWPWG